VSPHAFILFDLDGTLSDPLEGIGRSINHALAHYGYPQRELRELSVCVGPPLDQSFQTLTGIEAAEQLAGFVAKYRERYGDIGYAENLLYPGIPEALQRFADAGIPMGVCTSKRVDFAERILQMFGLRQHFMVVSGGDIGVHKWQQIEGLLQQGLIPASTVMVGDRAVDLTSAHRNGLSAAGVLWGHGSREELEAESPRYLLSSPAELSKLLGAA
jgi:phosphoglycolate phosphatase